jgi:hypothetical protein
MDNDDKALIGVMLAKIGDRRTVDEFLTDIKEASVEELKAWHRDARALRWTAGLVLQALEDAVPVEGEE